MTAAEAIDDPTKGQPQSPLDLLTESGFAKDGWQLNIGRTRSFFLRGASRFLMTQFRRPVTDIVKYAAPFNADELFKGRENWKISGFNWDEHLSGRQAIDALSMTRRRPLRFDKAVKVVLLCDAIAKEIQRNDGVVADESALDYMRIEPAIYYLPEFNAESLGQSPEEFSDTLRGIRQSTGQPSRIVLDEMARGMTVTRALAEKVRAVILEKFPHASIGGVESNFDRDHSSGASAYESLSD